jgi:predicted outer membrane repeat protein
MQGGALYLAANVLTISDSTFLSNTALDEGGAIYTDSTLNNTFFQNSFNLNQA